MTSPGVFDPTAQPAAGQPPSTAGQTLHGDHAYVFYQVPVRARRLPLVMWHGIGQFSKTWETTPDGREGYQTIFLRRGFGVYLVDQPRRGRAGRSTVDGTIPATPDEQNWFGTFRLGIWPDFFPGVQFSRDPEALNQYFRQMTPNVGPIDVDVNANAIAALFDQDRPRDPRHPFAQWRHGLAHRHQESERARDRLLRTRQRLRVPGRRSAAAGSELRRGLRGRRHPVGGVHAADEDPDRHLLRRQHPGDARSRMAARTDGGHGCRWRGCGAMPSTSGAATSRSFTCPRSAFAATRTFPSRI